MRPVVIGVLLIVHEIIYDGRPVSFSPLACLVSGNKAMNKFGNPLCQVDKEILIRKVISLPIPVVS